MSRNTRRKAFNISANRVKMKGPPERLHRPTAPEPEALGDPNLASEKDHPLNTDRTTASRRHADYSATAPVRVRRHALTERQRELYEFIGDYIDANDFAPSFEEMRVGLGYGSTSSIAWLLDALEERGAVTRLTMRARAVTIVPEGSDAPQSIGTCAAIEALRVAACSTHALTPDEFRQLMAMIRGAGQ